MTYLSHSCVIRPRLMMACENIVLLTPEVSPFLATPAGKLSMASQTIIQICPLSTGLLHVLFILYRQLQCFFAEDLLQFTSRSRSLTTHGLWCYWKKFVITSTQVNNHVNRSYTVIQFTYVDVKPQPSFKHKHKKKGSIEATSEKDM